MKHLVELARRVVRMIRTRRRPPPYHDYPRFPNSFC
jgi:hypothetical protein